MTDTALTRRQSEYSHQETWHIYFGDVHVGTIGTRAGVPKDVDQWGWHLGFYPGTEPGTHQSGSAETYPAARAELERAWLQLKPTLTEENYETWRRNRDWHEMRICNGCRMPNGKGSEFGASIKHAVENGWLEIHESGTYVRLMSAGENLLAR